MISKRNPSLVTTFAFLSCGYVLTSSQEVKSVVLRMLNRAGLTVAVEAFLKTGRVPTLQEGNMMENIFSFLWSKDRSIVLGSRFRDAFQDPNSRLSIELIFEGNIYALLKDQTKSDDILKAASMLMCCCISFGHQIQISLLLVSIRIMLIRCICRLLLILQLILLNLIRWCQLYTGLSRAKLQNGVG